MTDAAITVRDGIAYLSVGDPELWEAIVESTSFKMQGSQHRPGARHRDMRYKLVRNQKCPLGLLDRVCRVMKQYGVTPELTYANTQQAPKPRVRMRLDGVTLRDYQEEAVVAAGVYDRGIFRVPTGGGKTIIGGQIVATRGMHAVIVVPTIDLLYQFKDWLTDHLLLAPDERDLVGVWRIGQLGDGTVDPQPVTVATIRTMAKVLDVAYEKYEFAEYDDSDDTSVRPADLREWVQSIGTVLIDEAHVLGAQTTYDVATRIPAPAKYGMSASPWRDDGADLMIEAATGPCIYYVPPKRLVEGGWLLAPEVVVLDTSDWWRPAAWGTTCASCHRQMLSWTAKCECGSTQFRSQYTDAYREEIVENPIRNMRLAQIVQDLDRPTLVLVKQVKHGKHLAAMLPKAVFLSGRDKGVNRRTIFDQVRTGEVQTVICTTIADMGLDIPILGALVLAGGGKSSTRHLQRIGRVVRAYPGKRRPIVIDPDDSHIHSWFANHARARRQIEKAEWDGLASWRTSL